MPVCSAPGNPGDTGTRGGGQAHPPPHRTPTLPAHTQVQHRPTRVHPHRCTPRRLVPSGWRGSASPARLSRTASCRPPAAAARPERWSPWQRGAPQWPSGSPAWLAEPPAAPEQERPRETVDRTGYNSPPRKVEVPRVCTGAVLLCLCSSGNRPGTHRHMQTPDGAHGGLHSLGPNGPRCTGQLSIRVRGSRVAHMRQVCLTAGLHRDALICPGGQGQCPQPHPRPDPWFGWFGSQHRRIRKAPEKTVQQHHSGWEPWLQEAQADS